MQSIHHVAIFSASYAATATFYREAFGAEAPMEALQPSTIHIGEAMLHVFEREGVPADWSPAHLHHFALRAEDIDEFAAARDRLLTLGACSEQVIDFGERLSPLATDPDGGMVELLVQTRERSALPFAVEPHDASWTISRRRTSSPAPQRADRRRRGAQRLAEARDHLA
ncbi:MAG TPA: VOC family protein [Conexibacter sp.]|jgi:catechol 2,3-dioxygenase-like lactoylglutathione lyase family enzyme|nr:VOC family protein [Conexibacter sp.]